MFLVSRVGLLLIGTLTATQIGAIPKGTNDSWISLLCRFDCGWYLSIAESGYSTAELKSGATNLAFFPLHPLVIRLLAPLFLDNYLYAAVAISNVCFYVALVYVYRYVRLLNLDRTVAMVTVGLLCVMPESITFSAAYSEGLFLLLLVVAMFYLRREQYLAAGIAAAMLSATRANGIFFIVFALVWIVRRDGMCALLTPWRAPERFVPIIFAPLGLFLYLGYCFVTTGDAFAYSSTELYGWGWYFTPPWDTLLVMLRTEGAVRLAALCSLGVFFSSLLLIRERLYEEFALCLAVVLLMWSASITGSVFRYWLVLFPVWIALAKVLAPRPILSAMVFSGLASVNGVMMCAWTLQKLIAI